MPGIDDLSNEELEKIAAQAAPKAPAPTVDASAISDDELELIAQGIPPKVPESTQAINAATGIGSSIMGGVQAVGEFVDKFTGAPTRAAISEAQQEFPKDRGFLGRMRDAAGAFAEQFGEDPKTAPTGKQIAEQAGLPETAKVELEAPSMGGMGGFEFRAQQRLEGGPKEFEVSPAATAGVAIEMAADPLNIIPAGTLVRGAKKAIGMGAKGLEAGAKGAAFVGKAIGPRAAVEFAEGAAAGAKNALKALTKAEVAKDFDKLQKLAARHGIDVSDIDALRFGKDSATAQLARTKMQTLGGEGLKDLFNKKLQQTQQAAINFADKVGKGSVPADKVQAGDLLKAALINKKKQFFDSIDTSYQMVAKQNPDLVLTKSAQEAIIERLGDLEQVASRLEKSGATKQRGQFLRGIIDDFLGTKGNYQDTVDVLQNLKETIFAPQTKELLDPKDFVALRRLDSSTRKSLVNTVRSKIGGDTADKLVEANKRMRRFFDDTKDLAKVINNERLSGEQVYDRLIKNANTKTLNNVRTVLQNTDELKQLQGFTLKDQLKGAGLKTDELFSVKQTRNNLKNANEKIAHFIDPKDHEEFTNLIVLADEFGDTIANPSGTGIVNMLAGGVRNIAEVSGLLEGTLRMQRGRALAKAAERARPLFGPAAIGPREATFLRIPQQISRQGQEDSQGLRLPGRP